MNINPRNKQRIIIMIVVLIGVLLGSLILRTDRAPPAGEGQSETKEHVETKGHAEGEPAKGPHGGRMFAKDAYGVEVTIFEQGVDPQFRVYTYQNGKPLDPSATSLNVTLERLGRQPQVIGFKKENDYLTGNAVVEEPHSFKVTINARHDNKPYQFAYEQEEARVRMTDEQLAQNGVQILTAGPVRIKTTLQLIGEVRLNEDRTVHVVPRLSGVVESVSANAGDRVRKGQVLAVISSQVLADHRSELQAAQQRLRLARTTYEREKKLWEEKISAEQDYLQARATMQEAQISVTSAQQKLASLGASPASGSLTRYEIRSPIDGVITDKRIAAGAVMKDDANIFDISDLSTVWVDLTVRAQDINSVKVGQKATVKATAFDAQGNGTVSYIGSLVGEQTRTATARLVLANPDSTWRPGLPVNVELVADEVEVPVAVSTEAIQTVRDWNAVFGRYGNALEARPLELGRSDGKFVEVRKGLNAGEQYAAKNSFLIKADLGKASASHDQ